MTFYQGDLTITEGNDVLYGRANDFGASPAVHLIGALDNITFPSIHGLGGNDIIFGDLFTSNGNTDTEPTELFGDDGNDWIFGDTVDFSYAPLVAAFAGLTHITLTLADGTAVDITGDTSFLNRTAGSADVLHGGNGDDHLFGGGSFDILHGDAGNDVLDGNAVDDDMIGGAGNDTYFVDNVFDTVDELNEGGSGIDTVYSTVSYALTGTVESRVENLILLGSNTNSATGNALGNTLNGALNLGANTLTGLGGNDIYVVGAGDHVTEALGGGVDTVSSALGSLNLASFANVESITLSGSLALNATGSAAANRIIGNAGSNIINGMAGNDVLSGGLGVDYFVFNRAPSRTVNHDTITDFFAPQDTIRLENAVFTKLVGIHTLSAAQFWAGTAAHDLNDRIIYNRATGALSYDADGNKAGGVAAVHFATLYNHAAITNADFFII